MSNLLLRNLDENLVKRLKAGAKAHRRSLQVEIQEILRVASTRNMARTRRLSTRWLNRLERTQQSDSAAIIRADRARR